MPPRWKSALEQAAEPAGSRRPTEESGRHACRAVKVDPFRAALYPARMSRVPREVRIMQVVFGVLCGAVLPAFAQLLFSPRAGLSQAPRSSARFSAARPIRRRAARPGTSSASWPRATYSRSGFCVC